MAKSARVVNLERFKQRVMQRLPAAARAEIRKANEANAREFKALVEKIVPRDEGQLAATLAQSDGSTETAVQVSIGSAEHPYPLHLEAGHLAADGTHVAGKAFWNPARRVLRKKTRGRAGRALSKAVKATAAETP